jgi:hypothetical protein
LLAFVRARQAGRAAEEEPLVAEAVKALTAGAGAEGGGAEGAPGGAEDLVAADATVCLEAAAR